MPKWREMSELCMKTRADTNNRFSYSNANELIVKPLSGPPSQPPIVRTSNITSTLANILVTNFFCCLAVIAQTMYGMWFKGHMCKAKLNLDTVITDDYSNISTIHFSSDENVAV